MTTSSLAPHGASSPTGADVRRWLWLDVAVTGVNAVAYVVLARPLEDLLGPSPGAITAVGLVLAVFTAVVAWIARRRPPSEAAVLGVAVTNALWAAVSLVVAASGLLGLTGWGRAWVVAQAVVVATFAVVQAGPSRRRRRGVGS